MIRVAYLCEFSTLLGGERSLLTFLRAAQASLEPIVVCPAVGNLVDALDREGIERLSWSGRPKDHDANLLSQLTHRGVRLVHGNSLSLADVVHRMSSALSVPSILHVRDIATLSQRRWSVMDQMNALIGVSIAVTDWLSRNGVEQKKIHQIYNGVDVRERQRNAINKTRLELGLPADCRLIACIGQICLRKGQDFFMQGCQQIAAARDDVHFLIVGERYSQKDESVAFEHRIREMSESSPLIDRVHFLGYRHDVAELMPWIRSRHRPK